MADSRDIMLILKRTQREVDGAIKKILDLYVDKKYRGIVKYQMELGGKRIRPALAIISCNLLGGKTKDVLYPASGLEIIHNYSLIIDDIIDNSPLRRNNPTVWVKFGSSIAQCIAIDYGAAIFQAAGRSLQPVKISELFAKTLKILVEGEILDILFEQKGREKEHYIVQNRYKNIGEKDYFEMVSKKTAALFQTSCEIGAICAKANPWEMGLIKKYGFNLGVIFQIQDDILDIFGNEKKFGKKIGKDIQERKGGNIVILHALKELSKKDRKELSSIFKKQKISDSDIKKGMNLINKTDALQKSIALKQKFLRKAKDNLKNLPQNQWREILGKIADFVADREK